MLCRARSIPLLLSLFGAACGSAPFPSPTQANDARNADPWLAGSACPADAAVDADLRTEDLEPGDGRAVVPGDTVRVHYTAAVGKEGKVVHDSRDSGAPIEIVVGGTKAACGFELALAGMRAGGRRRVVVPARLAFGDAGKPPEIAPGTDVVFVIDLFLPATPGQGRGVSPGGGPGGGRRR
jgi:peptidylprolyl isomerase